MRYKIKVDCNSLFLWERYENYLKKKKPTTLNIVGNS